MNIPTLKPENLHRPCDPTTLPFQTTAELPDLEKFIGQPRAYRGLELGSEVTGLGYNIYVMGLPASGRTTLSREYLEQKAAELPTPDDLCYVNNFADPHEPNALHLPAGRGIELRKDMDALIKRSQQEIQRAFNSDEYNKEASRLAEDLQKNREAALSRLQAYAAKYNFLIARTPFGFVLVPSVDGQPLKPEEIEKLAPEKLEKLKELEAKVGAEVKKTLEKVREMERTAQESLQELDTHTALFVVEHLVDDLRKRYTGLDQVLGYLDIVQKDIVENVEPFRAESGPQGENIAAMREAWLKRYVVNVVVDNDDKEGAPVILENQPTYQNLVGRIEHEMVMGASRTDFTMIRPGALHRANGGYLILPIREVLINPYAWEGLKRCLRDGSIRIVELGNQLGLISTTTLEPEPIPLHVKVVLVGTPLLYYLLQQYDEDFPKLFKVRSEFASQMDRTPDTEQEYALFIRSVTLENQLAPFDRAAVARIIEHGSRMVEDQNKLSARFGKISDLVREAEYWARKNGKETVSAADVQRAIDESVYRSNLLEERLQALIIENTLMIDVEGTAIGQINALSVLQLGDYAFGRPSRVTATAQPGRGGVLDIERKAELGGAIHTKGVLIINGFLGGRYGREKPLNLAASLTFEQSYDGVEGDSASAAELFTLLSALTGIPLRQDLAITGSMNQHGLIQPIGGVNEKVEGFFAVCKEKGLTGTQGVVIPASNVKNLMLRDEVVQAVEAGQFHLWAIKTVDEGLEIFTGMEAGEREEDGTYPEGSFNRAVMEKLEAFGEVVKEKKEEEGGADEGDNKPLAHG
ncbi:MAG TPA: ATP-binding protein [Anaerolineales bacterium]|nr:ATP-binding protein [Anaerolineales bacterium]